MPSKPRRSVPTADADDQAQRKIETPPSLPLAEVLSFLKETRGVPTWTVQDLAKSLKISAAVANRVIPFLQVQGYVEPAGRAERLTTVSGEAVSESKSFRFTPETVTTAVSALAERIKAVNQGFSSLLGKLKPARQDRQ